MLTFKQKQDQVREKITALINNEWSAEDKLRIESFTRLMSNMSDDTLKVIYQSQIIMSGAELNIDSWTREQSLTLIQRLLVEEKLVTSLAGAVKDFEYIRDAYGTLRGMSKEGQVILRETYLK